MITEAELKKLFELDEKCSVDETNLNNFVKMVKGAYLLHKVIFENKISIETPFTNGKKAWLSTRNEGHSCWREHVKGYGSLPIIWVHFRYHEKLEGKAHETTPFWTTISDEELNNIGVAYAFWTAEFAKINAMFTSNYGVSMGIELDKYYSSNRWFFRTRATKFMFPFFYINEDGFPEEIASYNIKGAITQMNNIFLGRTLPIFNKIIDSISEEELTACHTLTAPVLKGS